VDSFGKKIVKKKRLAGQSTGFFQQVLRTRKKLGFLPA